MMFDIPANLSSQTEQYVDFHVRRFGSTDEMPQGMHERIGLGSVKEVKLL
jgi:hypothetical protein